jgi:hypothetical protein
VNTTLSAKIAGNRGTEEKPEIDAQHERSIALSHSTVLFFYVFVMWYCLPDYGGEFKCSEETS